MGIPVLVVDPSVDSGQQIKKSLEGDQLFQVTVATRAIEALMRFTETKYRVVIVDFGLPDLNGADLIRQMRGIDDNVLVLAVIDNGESYSKEIKQLAVNGVFKKPAHLSDLPLKLTELLRLSIPNRSPVKAAVAPSELKTQSHPDHENRKTAIQDKVVQSGPLTKESSPKEARKVETTESETTLKDAHPQKAAQVEAAQHSDKSDSDKEVASIQDETPGKAPPIESGPLPQKAQEEPSQPEKKQDDTPSIPPWLKEPAQVEQYLTALEQEHSAYATLLSIGNTPWTYSEQLTENQAHGIVRLLSEHDEGLQSKGALIRYIRLSGTGNDYLLYATPVIGNINLSLIFGMDTPFSVARRQAHRLGRLLVEQDPREVMIIEEEPIIEKPAPPELEEDEPLLPSEWIPGPKIPTPQIKPSVPPASPVVAEEPKIEKVMAPSLTDAPETAPIPNDWLPKKPRPTSHLPFLEQETPRTEKSTELEPINLAQQEPIYYLPFTAILIPRFPNHRLTGSLANQLENWLKDLCVAWGWRVDHIDLRADFLRFTFSLSPDIAPAQAVQHLANNLSSRILNAFPGLMSDLPSGQFWTKSYLLTAGSDVGKDRLALFIETTRKEQGLVN